MTTTSSTTPLRRLGRAVAPPFVDVPAVVPPGAALVEASGITVELGGRCVLSAVDLEVHAGEVVALVGPNGAGKSSLVAAVAGDVGLAAGRVEIAGQPLQSYRATTLARRRAVLPQHATVSFGFTVADVVRMGRAPWARTAAAADDDRLVAAAMAQAEIDHLAARSVLTLSGGERARVALARVLAQDTQLIILDEPTAALDVHHQELVLDVVAERAAAGGGAVVVVHDLSMAAAVADRIVVLAAGGVVAAGPPGEVMEPALLSDVWHHDLDVIQHPRTGELLVVPRRRSTVRPLVPCSPTRRPSAPRTAHPLPAHPHGGSRP